MIERFNSLKTNTLYAKCGKISDLDLKLFKESVLENKNFLMSINKFSIS